MYQLVICLGFSFVFFLSFSPFSLSPFSPCVYTYNGCTGDMMCADCHRCVEQAASGVWAWQDPQEVWSGSLSHHGGAAAGAGEVQFPHHTHASFPGHTQTGEWPSTQSVPCLGVDTDTCIPDPLAAWMKPKSKVWERLRPAQACAAPAAVCIITQVMMTTIHSHTDCGSSFPGH